MTTTLRAVLRHLPGDVAARIYTADDVGADEPEYLSLRAAGMGIPFYREMRMHWPRFGAFLAKARADRLDFIHYTTPGPVGLAARYVSGKLGLPMVGSLSHAPLRVHRGAQRVAPARPGDAHLPALGLRPLRHGAGAVTGNRTPARRRLARGARWRCRRAAARRHARGVGAGADGIRGRWRREMSAPGVPEVLGAILRHPIANLVRRWNWKAALVSALSRARLFFVVNLPAGRSAAIAALVTELVSRGATSERRVARATPPGGGLRLAEGLSRDLRDLRGPPSAARQ